MNIGDTVILPKESWKNVRFVIFKMAFFEKDEYFFSENQNDLHSCSNLHSDKITKVQSSSKSHFLDQHKVIYGRKVLTERSIIKKMVRWM